ncbi:helix-turn-helix transcriptional regulator [Streptomyces sp. NA04227]|uniref:helix-turn-helix transcriptional regulator n=1 Tax=Streptomyces sp. NA04227 TaxID=2742136 RepID=UPI0015923AEB|nr:helix-turn-helix transcriptional regulator [Streptomyces sp. NA04227]QKW07477.1 helix-turn-helix transcriptional regulator [Streptomyces sp. NA04227]
MHHRRHDSDELCEPGASLYAQTLRAGRVRHEQAAELPCLVDSGLLQPDVNDTDWLLPVSPAIALPRLLHAIEENVATHRRKESELAAVFGPLMDLDARRRAPAGESSGLVLKGVESITSAILGVAAESSEVFLIRRGKRFAEALDDGLRADLVVLGRGGRVRTLYQHTMRHSSVVASHFERYAPYDFEARSLDHLPDRLFLFDRKVAYVPVDDDPDSYLALELRHPTMVRYLVTMFQELWQLAVPLYPHTEPLPASDGITARQRAIAELLVEGETDARIAERLGMNVRTCRAHIAKLATTLGSENRAQLGYLIGKSGLLDREG